MKIGFFGTPEIAEYCLTRLIEKHNIAFIVTGEDKPSGRHLKMRYCPVKEAALKRGIKVFQPSSLLDDQFIENITSEDADIYVVVAYGKIIPPEVFEIPSLQTVNLHPSLLPKYRGAAPVQWVLINGETETGITIQKLSEKLDAGDILTQVNMPLSIDMTSEELYRIIIPKGADLLMETLSLIDKKQLEPVKQNENEASYCGTIDREIARVDWAGTSLEIHNLVRGLNPKPVAWTTFRGKNVKIWKTKLFEGECRIPERGNIISFNKKKLLAGTGNGCIEILTLQPETKRMMDALSFINGYRLVQGDMLV